MSTLWVIQRRSEDHKRWMPMFTDIYHSKKMGESAVRYFNKDWSNEGQLKYRLRAYREQTCD